MAGQALALARAVAALSPLGRAKRQALNSWVEMMQARKALIRAVRALSRRGERAGFNAWVELVHERADQMLAMSRAVAALSPEGRSVRQALNAWLNLAQQRAAMARAVRTLSRRGERAGFNAWVDLVRRDETARRAALSRAVQAMCHRGIRAALNSWADNVQWITQGRRLRRASLTVYRGNSLFRASHCWRMKTSSRLRLTNLITAAATGASDGTRPSVQRMVQRVFRHWIVRILAPCQAQRIVRHRRTIRSARRAFSQWLFLRYQRRAASVVHELVLRRTSALTLELAETRGSFEVELAGVRGSLEGAHAAARDETMRAYSAMQAAEDFTRKQREALEVERRDMLQQMEYELSAALNVQRSALDHEINQQLERAKQAWHDQHRQRDVAQEREVNALRLRLGLTQSSVCRLLVDKAQEGDYKLVERMATPPRSLHSLVARARSEKSAPATPPMPASAFGRQHGSVKRG